MLLATETGPRYVGHVTADGRRLPPRSIIGWLSVLCVVLAGCGDRAALRDAVGRVVREFSKKIKNIESELSDSEPPVNARIEIPGYFTNIMWLDLGQLVYLLRRFRSANRALERNLTFGSGDFWTETANLDRAALLSRR